MMRTPSTGAIPFTRPDFTESELEAVSDVVRAGAVGMGAQTEAFEQELAERCGASHAILLANGSSALHLALLAVGIGPGDSVITTPFTYVATVNAILQTGATPVFVDIDPLTYNLDVSQIAAAVTGSTRGILPVHVFGSPARMDELMKIANASNLRVVEDSCEALGSRYQGRQLGTWGDAGAFGFYANKQITMGEGGALVTDDSSIADLVRSMRHQGRSFDGRGYIRLGFNYKPSDLHASLGRVQLRRLPEIFRRRRQVMEWYRSALQEVEEVMLPGPVASGAEVEWFVCVVRLHDRFTREQRDQIMKHLSQAGIEVANYFPALHLQPYFAALLGHHPGDFPVTERVADRTLAIPYFSTMKEEEVHRVVSELKTAVRIATKSMAS